MSAKINKGLRAAITLSVLVIGAFFIVKAIEKNDNLHEVKTTQTSSFLVNKGTAFSPRATVDIDENCDSTNPRQCVYLLTSEGMANIPNQSSYTPSEIDEYLTKEWIEAHPNSNAAIYLN